MKAFKLAVTFIFIFSISLAQADSGRRRGKKKRHTPQRTVELKNNILGEFATDGCSMYPDGEFMYSANWNHCCIGHDISYWYGGTRAEKNKADLELNKCVSKLTSGKHGRAMELGVAIGGSASWGFPWSWGYGWEKSDRYIPVSSNKSKMILSKSKNIMGIISRLPSDLVGVGLKPEQIDYIKDILNQKEKDLASRIGE